MKKLNFFTYLFIFCITVFSSCSDEFEPIDPAIQIPGDGNGGNTAAVFSVDFNGSTFVASNYQAVITGGSIVISGIRASNGDSVSFIVSGTTTGSYPANDNIIIYQPAGTEYGYLGINPANPDLNTGSIIITSVNSINNTISGTFNFTGYWLNTDEQGVLPIAFTNGVFNNIPFTSENYTDDTFFAKVNGQDFVDVDIFTAITSAGSVELISVAGHDTDDNSITVSVRSDITPGTYQITGGNTDVVQMFYSREATDFWERALTGTVTVVARTATQLECTFSGVVTDGESTYTITQGAFDVQYDD
jgi:hypothetical protein